MFKQWLLALFASAVLLTPVVRADEEVDPNTGALTFIGQFDYTTAYYFRGANQEDARLIFQPALTMYANVYDGPETDASAFVGMWNSFHEAPTLSDPEDNLENWYEADFYGGVDFTCEKMTLGLIYTIYTAPGGAFQTIQEVGLKVALNDTGWYGERDFRLNPYAGVYVETSDENGTEDTYGEVGIAPAFDWQGLTIGIPVVVGLSIEDYFLDDGGDNEFLGYGSVGISAAMPLGLPSRYGDWTLTGTVTYLHLFAESLENLNQAMGDDDEDNAFIGKLGVGFTY